MQAPSAAGMVKHVLALGQKAGKVGTTVSEIRHPGKNGSLVSNEVCVPTEGGACRMEDLKNVLRCHGGHRCIMQGKGVQTGQGQR